MTGRSLGSIAALVVAVAVSCATPVGAGRVSGSWGGRGIALTLKPAGGTLEYDCAAGRIDGPIVPRSDGGFTVRGSHTPGTGGPERVDHPRPSYPATYSGSIVGERMTLRGRVANGQALGPFELRRGVEPVLLRCL